ncbi:cysteine hydrolase family protein [Alkalihalophilus marmarensis]|uniref:cysteine hydrolase family protein n=1 Tax=Alkalihalophilus marmarensis TaxID=521377 RepID=UPI002DB70ECA|nr:isochorismatase family cysteine hydrolase [Alkalihalophilus marmarensis]MEC2074370.1 cysteine hydrolase [Alkalihalophilus marmarensis]
MELSNSSNNRTALLIIDMISDFEFEDSELLIKHAMPVAKNIAALKKRANEAHIPVIYVNDNYGKWQSDFRHLVAHCLEHDVKGRPIVEILHPDEEKDYFVLKPKFSGFFATPLNLLLEHLNVDTLILTGVAGNMCVLFTANDAYMHDYKIYVPSDCTGSNTAEANTEALHLMQNVAKADITPSVDLDLPLK